MLNPFRKLSSQNPGEHIRSLVFFILFYLYLWLDVDLRLIYHGGEAITDFPIFFRGWAFFQQLISHPGGPVEYLSAFLAQFLYYSWAGALLVTLLAWLICLCTGAFIKAINSPRLLCVRFIPPILLLIIYTQYTHHFVITMALLTALLFVCLYLKITSNSKPLRLAAFLVLSVILYYIAGGAYLLFAVLCAIYELLFSRRWRIGLLYLLSALFIPYVEGVLVFGISSTNAFSCLLPFSWRILAYETRKRMVIIVYILYLFLPLATLALGLWRILLRSPPLPPVQPDAPEANSNEVKKKAKEKPHAGILSWYFRNNKLRWLIESLVLFVIAAAAVFFSHNNKLKALFEVDYYAYHKKWPQLLQAARHNPSSYFIVHAVNRALYHTGRLGYDMLSYPQHPDVLFLTSAKHTIAYWKRFDTYFDIGVMNMAESSLTESIARLGERPIVLKRLALTNLVKANSGAARVHLGALSKTLFYADWANNYLARLQSDPKLSEDKEIQRLRCLMMEKDYGFSTYSTEEMLLDLLEKNRQNRMAFEYLMACYMLTGQLDKFIQNLDRLDDFDYSEIPPLYEEAILIYGSITGRKVDLKGRHISRNTYQRARDFSSAISRFHGSNKAAAMRATARDFGDSYFFYYNFGFSGIAK